MIAEHMVAGIAEKFHLDPQGGGLWAVSVHWITLPEKSS